MPAEWEGTDAHAVLLSWPHAATDWADMLSEVDACYVAMAEAIAQDNQLIIITPEPDRVASLLHLDKEPIYVRVPTNDTWIRDYGPLTVVDAEGARLLDFGFNGWGLKFAADKDNLVNTHLNKKGVFNVEIENRRRFVLEGGSIESDGKGTILTTSRCLLSPNRNSPMSRDQIESLLKDELGAERVFFLDHGALEGDDTDSHIDTLARFAPNDTILYVATNDCNDTAHYGGLFAMERELKALRTADGEPYRLLALPHPEAIYHDGERLPATYANFLVTPRSVIMPTYGQPRNDDRAAKVISYAFPGKRLLRVDCLPLIRQHGSLHCSTMQIPIDLVNAPL